MIDYSYFLGIFLGIVTGIAIGVKIEEWRFNRILKSIIKFDKGKYDE